jgi:membrane-bound lytic murein transglycosylase D
VTPATVASVEPAPTVAAIDSAAGTVEPTPPATKTAPAAKAAATSRPAAAAAKTYTVRKGDNLSVIAKRFGLSVTRLKSLNGLKGSGLRPGQKLRVG